MADTNKSNKDYITNQLSNNIINMQSGIIERAAKQADFGFLPSSNFPCLLSIMCMLEHALDNVILYSDAQFSNITNLYNKVVYAANI